MSSAREAKMSRYAKAGGPEDDGGVEFLVSRLAADLRVSIRKLELHEVLSPAWLEMADTFGRVASISEMESKLASPKEQSGTLWETEEQALRIILEDGKLGICFRLLEAFKSYQRANKELLADIKSPAAPHLESCDKFEIGLGTVLLNAWNHTEALQMMDFNALVSHIADVLDNNLADGCLVLDALKRTGEVHVKQEGMVLAYLGAIARQFEQISEDRIMPTVRARGVFMRAVRTLRRIHDAVPQTWLLRFVQALALLADTEDFKTYRSQHVEVADLDDLLAIREAVLVPLQTDTSQRVMVRPLIDCIDRCKRILSSSSSSKK
jgi:hypothetical protein